MGCAGLCLLWGAAAVELRIWIWIEKQDWEGAKPFQDLGRNGRGQHHTWVPLAPQKLPGRRMVAVSSMDISSWLAQGEDPSGDGRK